MVIMTNRVRTLTVKGMSGYGHAECVLVKTRHLSCDFIGPQGLSFLQQDTEMYALGKNTRMAGMVFAELVSL